MIDADPSGALHQAARTLGLPAQVGAVTDALAV